MSSKKITKSPEYQTGLSPEALEAIEACVKRMMGKRDKEYFREFLKDLITNNTLHYTMLSEIPRPAGEVGKTKFDQLYDASQALAFPPYQMSTLKKLLGEDFEDDGIRIWRILFPEKFGISSVLIRAHSYQDAFALGCDYACRASLRLFRKIPSDLSIRVLFVTEKALRKILGMRVINKAQKRREFNLEGRAFTFKQLSGARIFALGHLKNDSRRSLARYVERKDLDRIMYKAKSYRISGVEAEVLMSDMKTLQKAFKNEPE
jgi:hypothetical protein